MFEQLLSQIFSGQCQLTSLHLDISKSSSIIDHLKSYPSHRSLETISDGFQYYCASLRRLNIQLEYTYFLECLIDHVPNLEHLSTVSSRLQPDYKSDYPNSLRPKLSNESWFNKVRRMQHYSDHEFLKKPFS